MCKRSQSLLIVGNGFDLAHNLRTSYNHFKKYLITEYLDGNLMEDSENDDELLPQSTEMPDGGIEFDRCEVVKFLLFLLGRTKGFHWQNFEEGLGKLDFERYFDSDSLDVLDSEGDMHPFHSQVNYEVFARYLVLLMMEMKDLFGEWIRSIDISNTNRITKGSILSKNMDVITFNYTKTIETLYEYNRILHIHGSIDKELIFGHGLRYQVERDFYLETLTFRGAQNAIKNQFKKPVQEILKGMLIPFIHENKTYETLYFWGFSFSKVDLPYIRSIFTHFKNISKVYIDDFNPTNNKKYETLIRKLGFTGQVLSF